MRIIAAVMIALAGYGFYRIVAANYPNANALARQRRAGVR